MNTTNHEHNETASTETAHDANAAPNATARAIDDLLASAVGLGSVWVRYGLEVGRLALRTQSAWMKGVSQLLEHVADAIETPKSATPSEPASDTTPRN